MLLFENNIKEYFNKDELTEDDVGGHVSKRIVRVNDDSFFYQKECALSLANEQEPREKSIEDCRYFKELYQGLQKGDKYVTYLNELIVPQDGSAPIYPHEVSCVIKKFYDDECEDEEDRRKQAKISSMRVYNEVVTSRLMNAMGIETVYNLPLLYGIGEDSSVKYDRVLSVDFMQKGYEYESLQCLEVEKFPHIFNDEGMQSLTSALYKFGQEHHIPNLDQQVHNVIVSLVYQIMARLLVCSDIDVYSRNFMLKFREGVDMALGPCFDYEMSLCGDNIVWPKYVITIVSKYIFPYLSKTMPKVLDSFVDKIKKLSKSGEIEKIMTQSIDVDNKMCSEKLECVMSCIDILADEWLKTIITPVR